MGDSVDNIPGIPGIGTKKTDKIFAQARDDEADPASGWHRSGPFPVTAAPSG